MIFSQSSLLEDLYGNKTISSRRKQSSQKDPFAVYMDPSPPVQQASSSQASMLPTPPEFVPIPSFFSQIERVVHTLPPIDSFYKVSVATQTEQCPVTSKKPSKRPRKGESKQDRTRQSRWTLKENQIFLNEMNTRGYQRCTTMQRLVNKLKTRGRNQIRGKLYRWRKNNNLVTPRPNPLPGLRKQNKLKTGK